MTNFTREEIKRFDELTKLLKVIVKNHTIAEHTKKVLIQNQHVKDFCEEARHFVYLTGENPLFIHYDISTWYDEGLFTVRVEAICCYDGFMEYERARLDQLHSAERKDIPGIN